jgi:predicted DNA-binding transcriptional regulator AlpA
MQLDELRIVRFKSLRKIFFGDDISRSSIDRWERAGNFPKRIQLGRGSVGWRVNEIKKWLETRSIVDTK